MVDWTKMDLVPKKDMAAWYQYDPATSTSLLAPDFSGNGRNLAVASGNEPLLAESPLNGQFGYYHDGTNDPLSYTGSVTAKHIFIIAAFDKLAFAGNEGLLSGVASGNVLTSKLTGDEFYSFGSSGYSYRKADVPHALSAMKAPMNGEFALIEIIQGAAGTSLDGIRIGQQLGLTARRFQGWWLEAMIYSAEQAAFARYKLLTYVAMRYWLWPMTESGLYVFPFPSNKTRSLDLDSEFYLSEPYEGDAKALLRGSNFGTYEWLFALRLQEEYLAAEQFFEQHYPLGHIIMRDHRIDPAREIESQITSPLREAGSEVTFRHNYRFETTEVEVEVLDEEIAIPPTNWALMTNGGTADANRTYLDSRHEQAFNGTRHTENNWAPYDPDGGSGGYDSGPDAVIRASLERDFEVDRTFSHIKLFFLRDSVDYSDDPTTDETFTLYGPDEYQVDLWNGSVWVNFITVTGNDKVVREHDFVARTASKLRCTALPQLRLVEFEVWSRDPDLAFVGPLETLQRAIIQNQWLDGLPTESASSFTANGGPSAAFDLNGDSDLLTFVVHPGLTLKGYVFTPLATPPVGGVVRNAWIINILGHETVADGIGRVQYFVDRGFNVVLLGMPNYEPNDAAWTYAHSMSGNISITGATHSQYASVIEPDGTPILPLFLDQVFRAANWIRETNPTARIHLTGHSGGGFMASMAAVLDDDRYFTVKNSNAGELPFALDDTALHVEQDADRPWWLGNDWTELYKIAARFGKFTKTHNEVDPFFPAYQRHHVFREVAEDVNLAIADDYPVGSFDIYVDAASVTHDYTNVSKQLFVDDCLAFEPGAYPPLDLVTTPVWAAYGLTKLYSYYDGPAIRIVDDNSVEEDIFFDVNGVLDTAALSGDAPYQILKVYDQSGNQGPATPFGGLLSRAPWLNVADKSIRFLDTGDPTETGFQLPTMVALTQAETFMKRKLVESPTVGGAGGWWKLSTATDSSHTPYTTGGFFDQFGSAERRGSFSQSGTLTAWHVMSAYSVTNDWAFRINNNAPETDATNVVAFPAVPIWGGGLADFSTCAKGYSTALVICSQKCSEVDRYSVIFGL